MSKEKNVGEMGEKKDQFVALAKEVYPLIEQIRGLIAKSPFEGSVSITVGSEGYMEFKPYESGWRMVKYRTDNKPVAQYEYREEIILEEGK